MKKILSFFKRLWHRCHKPNFYVIADSRDNSITFSEELFQDMNVMEQEEAKVFLFHLCNAMTESGDNGGHIYAFTLNPPFTQETVLADIQYNQKYKCVGFEALCPTVNRIFYDYGLPADSKAKLTVLKGTSGNLKYYIILPPYGERHQNHPQA